MSAVGSTTYRGCLPPLRTDPMNEALGDLWTHEPADARVITTNGEVAGDPLKGTEHAVMGRGVARQARDRYKGLDRYFGLLLKERGNVPMVLMRLGDRVPPSTGPVDPVLVSFPVKRHWRERANLQLIRYSARLLVELADREGWQHIVLPRPGCGNGGRDWVSEVQPILLPILDDRFTVMIPPREVYGRR